MPEQIYVDPAALSVDASEYIAFCIPYAKSACVSLFADDIKARGESFNDYLDSSGGGVVYEDAYEDDNTVVITEFWFRQPVFRHSVREHGFNAAGDIALCVLINGKEVKYVPKYWDKYRLRHVPVCYLQQSAERRRVFGEKASLNSLFL